MKVFLLILAVHAASAYAAASASTVAVAGVCAAVDGAQAAAQAPSITNQCISFTVGPGTGCAWMCDHCAAALGPAYYFPDGVCAYQAGGCAGSPQAGVTYTCCSAARMATAQKDTVTAAV